MFFKELWPKPCLLSLNFLARLTCNYCIINKLLNAFNFFSEPQLDSPPVGKFNKHAVIILNIITSFIPEEVIIQPQEEDCSRFQDIT